MIFKVTLLSDEVDSFKRVITIDSESTFLDLHHAILDAVGYTKDQPASFFICADDWEKLTEITLIEMDVNSEEDSYIMEETRLSEALEDEKQKFMYVFEYLTERAFFMELSEIIPGKNQDKPLCIKSVGNPPAQVSNFEEFEQMISSGKNELGLEEDFYGDKEFDMDELDEEGFEGLGGYGSENPYDDSY